MGSDEITDALIISPHDVPSSPMNELRPTAFVRIAGLVTEATIGGCAFLRVDVPESTRQPAYSKFFGNGAVYAMTPVSEEIARSTVEYIGHRPVTIYALPAPSNTVDEDDEGDDDSPF